MEEGIFKISTMVSRLAIEIKTVSILHILFLAFSTSMHTHRDTHTHLLRVIGNLGLITLASWSSGMRSPKYPADILIQWNHVGPQVEIFLSWEAAMASVHKRD